MNYLDSDQAAKYLLRKLNAETIEYWTRRLNNVRRRDRTQAVKLTFAKFEGKRGFYCQEDLDSYVEFEKIRRSSKMKLTGRAASLVQAYGLGTPNGGAYGRKFVADTALVLTEDTHGFVSITVQNPYSIFALDLTEAKAFSNDLSKVVSKLERFQSQKNQANPRTRVQTNTAYYSPRPVK